MDKIYATIVLYEKGKTITRRDLINTDYDCEILVNDVKLVNKMELEKYNTITYIFKKKYNDLGNMFCGCKLLKSILKILMLLM